MNHKTKKIRNKLLLVAGIGIVALIGLSFINTEDQGFDFYDFNSARIGVDYSLLTFVTSQDYTIGSCHEWTDFGIKLVGSSSYNTVTHAGNTYFPMMNELVDGSGKTIERIQLASYIQCDSIPSWASVRVSGTSQSFFLDGANDYSVGTGALSSISNLAIQDGVKKLLKSQTFDAQQFSEKLTVNPNDNRIQLKTWTKNFLDFTVTVNGVSHTAIKEYASQLPNVNLYFMTEKLEIAPPVVQANCQSCGMDITNVSLSIDANKVPITTMDTSVSSGRQIYVNAVMTDYNTVDPTEGSPTFKLTKPNGVVQLIKAGTFLKNVGDDREFYMVYNMLQNSDQGTWKVTMENVNRPNIKATYSFNVQNTPTSNPQEDCVNSGGDWLNNACVYPPTFTPQQICENSGGTYNTSTLVCTPASDINEIGIAKMGLIWKLYDNSGNIINTGDTRDSGSELFGLGNLQKASVLEPISLAESKAGTFLNWDYYEITTFMTLTTDTGIIDEDKLSDFRVQSPSGICAELTVVGKSSTGTTNPKCIIPATVIQTDPAPIIVLGDFRIDRSDIDTLGRNAQLTVGEDYKVHADIGGSFNLINIKTNVLYKGLADGSSWEQKFKFGSVLSKSPQQICIEQGSDYQWNASNNECELKTDQTPKQQCEAKGSNYEWNGELCQKKVIEVDCVSPNEWINGICKVPTDTLKQQCEEKENHEWKNNACVLIIIGGENTPKQICEALEDYEWKNNACVLIDDIVIKGGDIGICKTSVTACIDDALKDILDQIEHDREVRDQLIIIVVGLVAVLGIIAGIKFKQRHSNY